jgi:nucleotide sugar dehydrogenase
MKPSISNVGIIGLGYVGRAILESYKLNNEFKIIHTFDTNSNTNPSCSTLIDLVHNSDLIYICVPTPMLPNGECDTSIVEDVIQNINKISITDKILVIKSTVPPGTTQSLQNKYASHKIIFNPEFLTEANYLLDYQNQDVFIVGANEEKYAHIVIEEQKKLISAKNIFITDPTTAEMYKYIVNSFLAVKVSFANEMASIANSLNLNWDTLQSLLITDSRLGKTHWKVPGPDGSYGFGGTCLPKDLSAIITIANKLDIKLPILNAVLYRNNNIDRPEKDWEKLKGRAVT